MNRRVIHRGRVGEFGIERVTMPHGVEVDLEILRHPGASAVVPLHDDGSVTLIRQYRHAAGGMIWEIPAGKLEPGEDPAVCAMRELGEEAGLAGRLTHLSTIHTTPAFTDEVIHLYVATDLTPVAMNLDHDEFLAPERMPLVQALSMIRSGEITDAKTICGLFLAYNSASSK